MTDVTNRKIDVTWTVGAAYRQTRDNLYDYAILALPIFLFSLFSTYFTVSRAADGMMRNRLSMLEFDPLMIPVQIISIALYVMLLGSIVRRALLGPNGPRNSLGLGWGRREFRIIGRAFLVGLLIASVYAVPFALTLLASADKQPAVLVVALAAFGPLIAIIALVFICCRLCTYLIAPCLDADLDFRAAFRSTRGNVLRIFGSYLLTALPFMIGMMALSILFGSATMPTWESQSFLWVLPFLTAIGTGFTIVAMVLMALIYEQLDPIPDVSANDGLNTGTRLPEVGRH